MLEEQSRLLIEQYVQGWKKNDIQLIIACLEENITIIESHGPSYYSIQAIEQWFTLWMEAKSRILKWDLYSFYFCEKEKVAFCQWDFICVSNEKEYALPGASIVKFSDKKIKFIHEYRMTHPAYEWKRDKLQSA